MTLYSRQQDPSKAPQKPKEGLGTSLAKSGGVARDPLNPFGAPPPVAAPVTPAYTGAPFVGAAAQSASPTTYSQLSTSTSIHPAWDLSRRQLPDFLEQALLGRAQLYKRSATSDLYAAEGKSHAGIDGLRVTLRGDSVRCKKLSPENLQDSITLPDFYDKVTVPELYTSRFVPPPTIESVQISVGGQYGTVWNLEGTISVYDPQDLDQIEHCFLIPGNKIYFAAEAVKGWAHPQAGEEALRVQLPNKWQEGQNLEFAMIVTNWTFNYDSTARKWNCAFKAIGAEDFFLSVGIPYSVEFDSRGIVFIDGKGDRQQAFGIGQALYFVDAVGKEQSSLSAMEEGKAITEFKRIGGDPKGAIIPFNGSRWDNPHHTRVTGAGEVIEDPLFNSRSHRLYFTFEYVVTRLVNELILLNAACGTGLLEKSLEDLLQQGKYKIEFAEDSSRKDLPPAPEIPPESELPFLSANPAKVLFLGRAKYKDEQGQGVDFTEIVKSKGYCPMAVEGNKLNLKNVLIHGSVIEQAARQSQEIREYTLAGAKIKEETLVIHIQQFFDYICDTIRACSGKFVDCRLVSSNEMDTLNGTLSSILVAERAPQDGTYKCVTFDPIKGDGNTRACSLSSRQGSREAQMELMRNGLADGGEIGGFLRSCEETVDPPIQEEKQQLQKKLKKLQGRLGIQKFTLTDLDEAYKTLASYYEHRATLSQKKVGADQKGKLYIYMGMNMSTTIHGLWGFKMGNFMSSTAVPTSYKVTSSDKGFPFMVMGINHVFDVARNDWHTTLDGMLCFPPEQIQPVELRNA